MSPFPILRVKLQCCFFATELNVSLGDSISYDDQVEQLNEKQSIGQGSYRRLPLTIFTDESYAWDLDVLAVHDSWTVTKYRRPTTPVTELTLPLLTSG